MANESSEDRGGRAKHSRNWDQPDGLGWEVWRRARSTALLSQPMQRDLARLRTHVLRDPAPLLTDIRRRWALAEDSVVDRFSLSSPLFWARRRVFHDGVSAEPAGLAPLSSRRTAQTDVASSAFHPPLSGATELPHAVKTMGGERPHEPEFVQRKAKSSGSIDVKPDVERFRQTADLLQRRVSGPARPFATQGQGSLPERLVSRDVQSLPLSSRTPLSASVGRRQDMRLLGSMHAMTGSFSGGERARISAQWGAASVPAPLIASKRNRDFSTVMRATTRDLQAPALQQRETVGRQLPSPTPSPSAITRAFEEGIGSSNTAPPLDGMVTGRKVITSSRIAVSKESTAGSSFERTTQTQNAAGDGIRRQETQSLLQAKYDSELPVAQPVGRDESVIRTAAEPARENLVGAEPMLAKHATSEAPTSATVFSRKPEYEAMEATPLPLTHTETPLPLHTVTPRNRSTVNREISLSRAEQSPVLIKGEDRGAKAADRHDPAGVVRQAPATGLVAKSVELSRSLDQSRPGSARAVDVNTAEFNSQAAARGAQPFVYSAAMLHRLYDHRGARLWHEAGDPRMARWTSPLTRAHYGGGAPMQRSEERADVASWHIATSRRVSELTGPGTRTTDTISFATAASSMAQAPVMPGERRNSASDLSGGDVGRNDGSSPGIGRAGSTGGAIGNETGMAQRESIIQPARFREIPLARHAIATSRQKEVVAADKPFSQLTRFLPITSGSERVVRGFSQVSRAQREQDSPPGSLHPLPVASRFTIATLDNSTRGYRDIGHGLPADGKFSAAALDGLAAGPRIGNAMVHRFSPVSSFAAASGSRARVFSHDLPLAPPLRIERSENSAAGPRSGDIVQAASQSSVAAMNGTDAAALIGNREESRAPQTNADPVAAQMDIDELVEKAWQKIMRKLTIEQERRGYTR